MEYNNQYTTSRVESQPVRRKTSTSEILRSLRLLSSKSEGLRFEEMQKAIQTAENGSSLAAVIKRSVLLGRTIREYGDLLFEEKTKTLVPSLKPARKEKFDQLSEVGEIIQLGHDVLVNWTKAYRREYVTSMGEVPLNIDEFYAVLKESVRVPTRKTSFELSI
eukprot:CAMPEP_0184005440 /NCGR_PEP_ID=MMETSP0954-20121128/67_1 /TAXON_ID=627963 /ORGANISM="Aplanochytrium sp, Strain PBS07" /LENGTH=162 /DNA_ID=CAMNT_0026283735 /DNA_START=687 /DNA_END=1175 /DNA_ORIENTATION=+